MTTTALLEALLNGLSFSSILILTAVGLSITFGVMRVINMAHGDMMMLGAYVAWYVSQNRYLPLDLFWAIPISFLVVGLVGYLLEMGLIQFLYNRPLDTLLATWGVGLVLQQGVRLWVSADQHALEVPEGLDGNLNLAGVLFPASRVFVIAFAALCLLGIYGLFNKTSFGLQVRAVTQNRATAAAMGISTRRIDSLTFAFGTGLAGVAGCIFGHMFTFAPDVGTRYVVDAFMVVILGGMGHLGGAIVAGLIMGVARSVLVKWFYTSDAFGKNPDMLAQIIVLLVVIGFILCRPQGLFASKERTYD